MRGLFSFMLTLSILGTVMTALVWYVFSNRNVQPGRLRHKSNIMNSGPVPSRTCKGCRDTVTEKVVERYSHSWKKQEDKFRNFRSLLSNRCHGLTKAMVTQANTPLGSKVVYDGEKRKPLQVTPELFSTFAKENPFVNTTWDTCSVVGNGGILANSSCGEKIDSAQFVIRCNLPPLENGYERDVGNKTDLVTANPSILMEKYGGLQERRRPFVESLRSYGDSLMLLPAFSYGHNTPVSLRALYTIQDFDSPSRPVFLNPEYLQSLARFWQGQGLRTVRLSTGLIVASLALELCANVHLYGFWPFNKHPHRHQNLTNHYYDDRQSKKTVHAMPAEFDHLLRLHTQGVLRIHLGECTPTASPGCSSKMAWASASVSGFSLPVGSLGSAMPTLVQHNTTSQTQKPWAGPNINVSGPSGLGQGASEDPIQGSDSEQRTKHRRGNRRRPGK
ncbi:alpha-2,8-sialyltransferase 8E isoform X1 [Salmo salar]|uniref:Alpha-2,8-sialyltransferase 8E isoform X1 n=2 Tax=Salmo salar TaxID=8030 RepID=A0A1S3S5C9_SALSA|nr:alpha-2,8-sialyltransferase 8E-like isoform X1 [Salmo salar]|eukprot:XP_014059514.1 PREDICTED: alpha-2,8-sialyltransferase 8E-like isoform X1 [Salmo salar]